MHRDQHVLDVIPEIISFQPILRLPRPNEILPARPSNNPFLVM
ncbi:uncharacterized protein METZ01_LOCUS359254, partial [marine metagenome]